MDHFTGRKRQEPSNSRNTITCQLPKEGTARHFLKYQTPATRKQQTPATRKAQNTKTFLKILAQMQNQKQNLSGKK